MAELLGIIASGITLANLYQTCLEAFDLIQTSRNQEVDFKKLKLRLTIEKCRLYVWGQSIGLTDTTRMDQKCPTHNLRFPEVVREILEILLQLFCDSQTIQDKYGCRQATPLDKLFDSSVKSSIDNLAASFSNFKVLASKTPQVSRIMQKVSWVIHDRNKFVLLITEIKDLIDSLPSASVTIETLKRRISKIQDAETLCEIAQVCSEDHPDIAYVANTKADTISLASTERRHVVSWTRDVKELEPLMEEVEEMVPIDLESLTVTELKHKIIEQHRILQLMKKGHSTTDLGSTEIPPQSDFASSETILSRPPVLQASPLSPDEKSLPTNDSRKLRTHIDTGDFSPSLLLPQDGKGWSNNVSFPKQGVVSSTTSFPSQIDLSPSRISRINLEDLRPPIPQPQLDLTPAATLPILEQYEPLVSPTNIAITNEHEPDVLDLSSNTINQPTDIVPPYELEARSPTRSLQSTPPSFSDGFFTEQRSPNPRPHKPNSALHIAIPGSISEADHGVPAPDVSSPFYHSNHLWLGLNTRRPLLAPHFSNRRYPTHHCEHHDCLSLSAKPTMFFFRRAGLEKHYRDCHPKSVLLDCPIADCDQKGSKGFLMESKLRLHLQCYHGTRVGKRITPEIYDCSDRLKTSSNQKQYPLAQNHDQAKSMISLELAGAELKPCMNLNTNPVVKNNFKDHVEEQTESPPSYKTRAYGSYGCFDASQIVGCDALSNTCTSPEARGAKAAAVQTMLVSRPLPPLPSPYSNQLRKPMWREPVHHPQVYQLIYSDWI